MLYYSKTHQHTKTVAMCSCILDFKSTLAYLFSLKAPLKYSKLHFEIVARAQNKCNQKNKRKNSFFAAFSLHLLYREKTTLCFEHHVAVLSWSLEILLCRFCPFVLQILALSDKPWPIVGTLELKVLLYGTTGCRFSYFVYRTCLMYLFFFHESEDVNFYLIVSWSSRRAGNLCWFRQREFGRTDHLWFCDVNLSLEEQITYDFVM